MNHVPTTCDCIIVGGGIAGLQCAIVLGRYRHDVLVLDANRGRSTLCRRYHNLLGWPDGVGGLELRALGRQQAQQFGVHFETEFVTDATCNDDGSETVFELTTHSGHSYRTRTVMFATGVVDHIPSIPGLEAALGISAFICPDCDGYECLGKRTVVLGAGDTGANMALDLQLWTGHVVYVKQTASTVSADLCRRLADTKIDVVEGDALQVVTDGRSTVRSVVLVDGRTLDAERLFLAFGGNQVESTLPARLGAKLVKRHIAVHPRTKMTSVARVWAAGDVVAHSEQVSIAMGDGTQAAIFIHKALRGEHVDAFTDDTGPP